MFNGTPKKTFKDKGSIANNSPLMILVFQSKSLTPKITINILCKLDASFFFFPLFFFFFFFLKIQSNLCISLYYFSEPLAKMSSYFYSLCWLNVFYFFGVAAFIIKVSKTGCIPLPFSSSPPLPQLHNQSLDFNWAANISLSLPHIFF